MSERYYAKSHEWAFIDGKTAKIGISDYAQKELGDIVFVELPEVGATVSAGETLCEVESVKAVSEIYAPVSGVVTAVNSELEDKPELLNEDALNAWICEVAVSETPSLMTETEYLKTL